MFVAQTSATLLSFSVHSLSEFGNKVPFFHSDFLLSTLCSLKFHFLLQHEIHLYLLFAFTIVRSIEVRRWCGSVFIYQPKCSELRCLHRIAIFPLRKFQIFNFIFRLVWYVVVVHEHRVWCRKIVVHDIIWSLLENGFFSLDAATAAAAAAVAAASCVR